MERDSESPNKMSIDLKARAETLALLVAWEAAHQRIVALVDSVEAAIGIQPEGQFHSTVWGTFDRYTRTLAKLLKCEHPAIDSDLHWYWHECRMGKNPMGCTQNGVVLRIDSIDALATLIAGNK
jgi:hypothetical protein